MILGLAAVKGSQAKDKLDFSGLLIACIGGEPHLSSGRFSLSDDDDQARHSREAADVGI